MTAFTVILYSLYYKNQTNEDIISPFLFDIFHILNFYFYNMVIFRPFNATKMNDVFIGFLRNTQIKMLWPGRQSDLWYCLSLEGYFVVKSDNPVTFYRIQSNLSSFEIHTVLSRRTYKTWRYSDENISAEYLLAMVVWIVCWIRMEYICHNSKSWD